MSDEKRTGSYYTPHSLIKFMIDYLKIEKQDFSNVLEPSAGDGRFLSFLNSEADKVDAVEIAEEKVNDIKKIYCDSKINVIQADFLDYAMSKGEKYSLIIGNPPYISPKIMGKKTTEKARKLCEKEGIASSVMQNMWLAFVVGACRMLLPDGTVFFVLPAEFLQVQYAEKLRIYLEKYFNTIHIISFQKSVFKDIEQETCLVYLTNNAEESPHILYKIYTNIECPKLVVTNIIKKNKPLQKWSNAILSDEDISLLKEKKSRYRRIDELGNIAPGIVTGGNKYFILTGKKVEELKCKDFVLPILQKSSFMIENNIVIDDEVMRKLQEDNKPMYLLNLANVKENLPVELTKYLKKVGNEKIQDIELKKRFKCANRKPWYGVPIVKKGDVVFFKRYGVIPRLYINEKNIHTTDAGYHIRLKDEYDKDSLVFCFYNSLTLAQCEYNGRYYGGGVRELVPSEFKKTTVPYNKIDSKSIKQLKKMFKEKASVEEIIKFVNSKTIALEMTETEIEQLEKIRLKLMDRRIIR